MAASIIGGPLTWGLTRTSEGEREFRVTHRVETTDVADGPQTVMNTPGLPATGSIWNFGNDSDLWAFCRADMEVSIYEEVEGVPNKHWSVEQRFSTAGLIAIVSDRCQDTTVTNPLIEPMGISGSFVPKQIEATRDRNGNTILYSNKQKVKGSGVTFDDGSHTVRIDQNVLLLGLETFSQMINKVNISPMWGLPVRRVKLSNVTWSRKFYGVCTRYYTRSFHFDVNFNGFDNLVLDEGDYVLKGDWINGVWTLSDIGGSPPDADNPAHYQRAIDIKGFPAHLLLDGTGKPLNLAATEDDFVYQTVEYYPETNFFVLGIPVSF